MSGLIFLKSLVTAILLDFKRRLNLRQAFDVHGNMLKIKNGPHLVVLFTIFCPIKDTIFATLANENILKNAKS